MRYLIITSEFPPGPGGIGKHSYCLAKALVHNGITVDVVCNMDYVTNTEINSFIKSLPNRLKIYRINRNGILTYVHRVKTIFRLYKKHQYDKVLVSGQFSLWIGAWLKKHFTNDTKVEAFIHGSELYLGGKIKHWLTHQSLKALDKLYPVSGYTAKQLAIVDGKKVRIVPNGLDFAEWNATNKAFTLRWDGYPKLLTVGSISDRKGQQNVILALPQLLKSYPRIHYHIVGKTGDTTYLIALIKKLGVQKHVTIHGVFSETDLRSAYKSVDILCLLSEHTNDGDFEGFGISVLEANVMGLPAIGSKNSGIEDAIRHGYNGYLVDAHNTDDIKQAIDRILESDRMNTRQQCISWANRFNWNSIVKDIL